MAQPPQQSVLQSLRNWGGTFIMHPCLLPQAHGLTCLILRIDILVHAHVDD